MAFDKMAWQRDRRRKFKEEHGYSDVAHYATGQLREAVLERDGRACVKCGMTEAEHLAKWERPITVDHKNKDRSENTMDNLQTLCLVCHGRKDIIPSIKAPKFEKHKEEAIAMRRAGRTYREIADAFGFSIAIPFKWLKIWGEA